MQYFTKDFTKFLNDLTKNNNREWFQANKTRYETAVKNPFQHFITDLLSKVFEIDNDIAIEAKEAIFRINRDIRFAKDKTPYKTNVSANIAPNGRKDMINTGFYLECNAHRIGFYSGIYMPDTKTLKRIREYIIEEESTFKKLITDKQFIKHFGEVRGDKSKVLAKEFKEASSSIPLIYNKQFLMIKEWSSDQLISPDMIKIIIEAYKASRPFSAFLCDAATS